MPSLPVKMKILLILAKTLEKHKLNFSRSAQFHMKTRVSLKYFMNNCRLMENDDITVARLRDCMKNDPMSTGVLFISRLSTIAKELSYSNFV